MKTQILRKPATMTRDEWINHLCVMYPTGADMIRAEAVTYAAKVPVVRIPYLRMVNDLDALTDVQRWIAGYASVDWE